MVGDKCGDFYFVGGPKISRDGFDENSISENRRRTFLRKTIGSTIRDF